MDGQPGIKEDPCCAVASAQGSRGLGCSVAARLPRAHLANVFPEGAREFRANGRDQGERGRKSDAQGESGGGGRGGAGVEGGYADIQPQREETS